ncbi:MAG: outer membrane lipoprotein carrier protein LolA [Saprospiraceae bacterium]
MKNIWVIICLMSISLVGTAQTKANQFTKATDSDPKAKKILDKVKKQYDTYQSLYSEFILEIEIPEQAKEVQKGKIAQQGDKYRFELQAQEFICDGETVWIYLKKNKEVQINDAEVAEEDGEMLSPKKLLTIYEQGEYAYMLTNETYIDRVAVQQIEFKPLDEDSEYFKIRLTVEKKSSKVQSIKIFSKDGSRFTLTMNKIVPNKKFAADYFSFVRSKYPKDVHVEDLRE